MGEREDGSLKAGKEMHKAFVEKGSGKAGLESAASGKGVLRPVSNCYPPFSLKILFP